MDRRKFIERLSVSLAAASAATLQSCSSTGGKYLRSSRNVNVQHLLNRIDEVNSQIASDELFDVPSRYCADHGCSPLLFRETIQALLLVGVFGDLSREDQMNPFMQNRIRESAGLFDRTALGMATFLENLGKEQRDAVRRQLLQNPEMIQSFQTAFDKEARKNHVPFQRLQHFHTVWNRVSASLKRRNNTTIIDEYIEKVDKVALQNGITPELRRKLAKEWDEELVVALSEKSGNYEGPDALLGSVSLQQGGDVQRLSKKDWRLRTGQKLLGISAAIFGGALIFLTVGLAAENIGLIIPSWILGTGGVVVFIIGLVMIISGVNTPQDRSELRVMKKSDPVYREKVKKAAEWVANERKTSKESLERIVLDAVEKFDVEFNDVWELVE